MVMCPPTVSSKMTRKAGQMDELEVWRSIIDSWKRLQRSAEKNLSKADISVADYRILKLLRDEGSSPMNGLCRVTMLSQPTITGTVDKLEERGLVERVRSRQDRREVFIALTSKGAEVLRRGEDMHRKFVEKSLSVLDKGQVEAVVDLLRKLADVSDSLTASVD